jgi:hypothetical protein
MKFILAVLAAWALGVSSAYSQTESSAVKITPVSAPTCEGSACRQRDALFFIHGIFGSSDTFKNASFNWPRRVASDFGTQLDVYEISYDTLMLNWLRKDIATFDEVAAEIFDKLHGKFRPGVGRGRDGLLKTREYRSVGFIAHSLGGNFVATYVHSIKSELGHEDRARNSFLITLGTPASGAQIANVGEWAKRLLVMNDDPLLESLRKDNTFLRMLASWRRAEDRKARQFKCRPVHLYVGIEGGTVAGIQVVSRASAEAPYRDIAVSRYFETYNHSRIAAPESETDPLYVWVNEIIGKEIDRINRWREPTLCGQNF